MIVIVFLCLHATRQVLAECSGPGLVSFPVQDVSLSNGQVMRGIPVGVGTPYVNYMNHRRPLHWSMRDLISKVMILT